MAKVLFVNGPGEGHVNPTLGLVEELIRRGEEVVYLCMEEFREKIERTGAQVRTYENILEGITPTSFRSIYGMFGLMIKAAHVLLPLVKDLQEEGERFDYLVHDSMFFSGRLVGQVLGIPAISSTSTFALTEPMWEKMVSGMTGMLDRAATPEETEQEKAHAEVKLRELKEQYGVRIDSWFELFYNPAELTICYTSREFQMQADQFDDSVKFVGPSITPRLGDAEFPYHLLEEKPVVYVSMGTILNNNLDFFRLCMEAFADLEVTVLLSIGRSQKQEDLGELPPNVLVYNYVPQLEVLQRTAVFLTHGGMNSTSESLYYGVPTIVIPQVNDQPIVGAQVEATGAGLHLPKEQVTRESLRAAVVKILADPETYRAKSQRIGDSFRAAGGYERAADEILAYVDGKLASQK